MSLLRRAARVSDVHTLTIAIRRLEEAKANPRLIAALDDLRVRIVAALNTETPETQPSVSESSRDATEAKS